MIKESVNRAFDLTEVRKGIETWAAHYAGNRATEEDIETLARIIEGMKSELDEDKLEHLNFVEGDLKKLLPLSV